MRDDKKERRTVLFPTSNLQPPTSILELLSFIAVFALLFWPTFLWMAERFDAPDSFYSHGWLVPLASAWLVFRQRAALDVASWRGSYQGLLVLVPSLIVHIAATWWRIHVASGLAMLGVVWGLVWTVWGREAITALRFPLLFLGFMVPLPGILLIAISFKMKLIAASLATYALHGLGIQAAQAGSTIHVPGVSVIVDDTCSGLRSLISLLALASFWTALLPARASRWRRLAIVAASLPIALAGNMLRIALLVMIAVVYGARAAEGFVHYASGLVVFGVALAALAWLSGMLIKSPRLSEAS